MTQQAPLTTSPLPVRLRVEDYLLLDGSGAFEGYGKTELLDGEIVYMNAQHRPRARIKSRLYVRVVEALRRLDGRLEAVVEASIAAPPHNVPEPDIAITGEIDGDGLLPLGSVALVIEVAATSLRNDLDRKRRIYARLRIPEYWVVDVRGEVFHRFWAPVDGDYSGVLVTPFGEPLVAQGLPGLVVTTDGL